MAAASPPSSASLPSCSKPLPLLHVLVVFLLVATPTAAAQQTREALVGVEGDAYDYAIPSSSLAAIDAAIKADDALIAGDLEASKALVNAVLADRLPKGDADAWAPLRAAAVADQAEGKQYGDPAAYAALRMLDQIHARTPPNTTSTNTTDALRLAAIVVRCNQATRPKYQGATDELETVSRDVDPSILEGDARVLREATGLLRRWLGAVTDGPAVALDVHVADACVSTPFRLRTDVRSVAEGGGPGAYFRVQGKANDYDVRPEPSGIINAVPWDVRARANAFLVVYPSPVPMAGATFPGTFIGRGAALHNGIPALVVDDLSFLRKQAEEGTGEYSRTERRLYYAQRLQALLMHALFATWPAFGLEASSFQWLERSTWPADFLGVYEADYFAEAIDKRFANAAPPLGVGLSRTAAEDAPPFDALPSPPHSLPTRPPALARPSAAAWPNSTATRGSARGT